MITREWEGNIRNWEEKRTILEEASFSLFQKNICVFISNTTNLMANQFPFRTSFCIPLHFSSIFLLDNLCLLDILLNFEEEWGFEGSPIKTSQNYTNTVSQARTRGMAIPFLSMCLVSTQEHLGYSIVWGMNPCGVGTRLNYQWSKM